jgi:hypothetical protein
MRSSTRSRNFTLTPVTKDITWLKSNLDMRRRRSSSRRGNSSSWRLPPKRTGWTAQRSAITSKPWRHEGGHAKLYKDKLIPAMREGAEAAGKNPDDIDRLIEIKIAYATDPDLALENTRFWVPLSLTAEQKTSIHDPLEMEKAADALPIEQVAKRWIVAVGPRRSGCEGQGLCRLGPEPPGVPRAGSRPAPLPGVVPEGSRAPAATALETAACASIVLHDRIFRGMRSIGARIRPAEPHPITARDGNRGLFPIIGPRDRPSAA